VKKTKPLVAVIGLGRTGLPVALATALAGVEVLGIDTNPATIDRLRAGEVPFEEEGMSTALRQTLGSAFNCALLRSVTPAEWARVEIILIHVGFSLDETSQQSAARFELFSTIARLGLMGKTIVLRTTVQVGLTRRAARFLEERTGLKEGQDFFVVYVPERLWEGKAMADATSLPHLVGALSPKSCPRDHYLFEKLGKGRVIHVSAPEVAEVVKLAENAWRDTTFAFANDLAMFCDNLGIDMFEVLKAANTPDYPWNNIPLPGPVSGYCLKKDPLILANSESDGMGRLWVHGRKSNERLVETVASRVLKSGVAKALVAGISFKKDVDDFRDSHSLDLIRMLRSKGLEVVGCDPFIQRNPYATLPEDLSIKTFESIGEAGPWLKDAAVVLATPHSFFAADSELKALLVSKPSLILDMWGFWREVSENFKWQGIKYVCIGSGEFWQRDDIRQATTQ
jgi:nucleotide sugar dehydrogenase